MLFMVIETFRNQDAKAIYRRLRDHRRPPAASGKDTAGALAPLL